RNERSLANSVICNLKKIGPCKLPLFNHSHAVNCVCYCLKIIEKSILTFR
ncbi:hypothetical protein L9F63_024066, partial [Diploptera punctata]